jgi:hypothetical protein
MRVKPMFGCVQVVKELAGGQLLVLRRRLLNSFRPRFNFNFKVPSANLDYLALLILRCYLSSCP